MPHTYLKRILDARIYDLAVETPLDIAPVISSLIDNKVFLKREDLQPVFSFKIRGAYNKLLHLSEAQKSAGIVTASAGNHAQGLSLAAKHIGIQPLCVMPLTTPSIKVDAVKRRGANVLLHGNTYNEASQHGRKLAKERNMTYIPPYDDPDVIAGQGTVAVEILRQHTGHIDAIFIPVGGGGLCAGMAAYIKSIRPEIKVIAVEAEESACLKAALRENRRVTLSRVGAFADGVAVAQIGKETFRIMKQLVDEVVTASTDEICSAIKNIYEDTRSIAEPAGALSLAGLKKYTQKYDLKDKVFIAINSGANTNFDRLRYISERTMACEEKQLELPEIPSTNEVSEFNKKTIYRPKYGHVTN